MIFDTLTELSRNRNVYLRSENTLSNRIYSVCFRLACAQQGHPSRDTEEDTPQAKQARKWHKAVMDHAPYDETTNKIYAASVPLLQAKESIASEREKREEWIAAEAKKLPVAHLVKQTRGLSYLYLGLVFAETGDLNNYRSKSALWSRMGKGLKFGEIQHRTKNAEKMAEMNYDPKRNCLSRLLSENLIGGMQKGHRPFEGERIEDRTDLSYYERLFMHRLRHEAAKDPKFYKGVTEKGKESYTTHAANRAKRYVVKMFLRDLRNEWIRVTHDDAGEVKELGFGNSTPAFVKKQPTRSANDLLASL